MKFKNLPPGDNASESRRINTLALQYSILKIVEHMEIASIPEIKSILDSVSQSNVCRRTVRRHVYALVELEALRKHETARTVAKPSMFFSIPKNGLEAKIKRLVKRYKLQKYC